MLWPFGRRRKELTTCDDPLAMVQTEDCFTSLTLATCALVRLMGGNPEPDVVAVVTGDAFALRLSPLWPAVGMARGSATLEEGLQALGLPCRMVTDVLTRESGLRVAALMQAAVSSRRALLVCGGWEPSAVSDPTSVWGLVHATDVERAAHRARAPRELGAAQDAQQDWDWPGQPEACAAVYLPEEYNPPPPRPRRRARRALERGLSLLAGHSGDGGLGQYAELLQWLRLPRNLFTEGGPSHYPYPQVVAVRCQLECLGRFLRSIAGLVPPNRRAARAQLTRLVENAAALLLRSEPERVFPRTALQRVAAGEYPWKPGAWDERRAALDDPHSAARQAEIARVEELRDLHGQILDALDLLLSR